MKCFQMLADLGFPLLLTERGLDALYTPDFPNRAPGVGSAPDRQSPSELELEVLLADATDRSSAARALEYMGLAAGTPIADLRKLADNW